MNEHIRVVLSDILGVLCIFVHDKNLGLPTFVDRAKRKAFFL